MPITEETQEAGKATRFGGERVNPRHQDNSALPKPNSIRNTTRFLAGLPVDLSEDDDRQRLAERKHPRAYAIAMKALSKAMAGNMRAIEWAADQTDGKLPQPITMQEIKDAMEGDIDVLNGRILAAAAEVEAEKKP